MVILDGMIHSILHGDIIAHGTIHGTIHGIMVGMDMVVIMEADIMVVDTATVFMMDIIQDLVEVDRAEVHLVIELEAVEDLAWQLQVEEMQLQQEVL